MNHSNNPQFNKILVVVFAFLATLISIYFMIPRFESIDKIKQLSKRLDLWNISPDNNQNQPNWNNNSNNNSNENNQGGHNSSTNNNGNQNQSNNNSNQNNNQNQSNENNNSNENNQPNNKPSNNPNDNPEEEQPNTPDIPMGEKITFKATFYKNGADGIETTEKSCSTDTGSCSIILPNITRNNGEVYGWSTTPSASDGFRIGTSYQLTRNIYFYAITSKTNSIRFDTNGASLEYNRVSCKAYNTDPSCSVKLPIITRTNGFGIGFSTNKDATKADYTNSLTITNDFYLYAISASTYQATFHSNGALKIGSTKETCIAYNLNQSCLIKTPSIDKDSYTDIGWSTNPEDTNIPYQVGTSIALNKALNLYAIRKISSSGFLTSEAKNTLSFINQVRASNGKPALTWSNNLMHSAMLRTKEIIAHPIDHIRPNGTDFYTVNDFVYGENWTQSYTSNPSEMHNMFVGSAPHFANMINSEYTKVGIAGIYNPTDHLYYWVELFG